MVRIARNLLFALTLACLPTAALAQRDLKDIPDPDPELERKALQLAEGFEINLFAADPELAKPIHMNFDSAGRLWLACSETYPQIKPGQKANDKIIVLEDRDGDGKADHRTTFADGLLIPTGLEPGNGGVYVANSTELLHLSDTNGDGKADRRRVVLSGFGTEDTHHLLHTLRWGHDGNLYFNQSIYIHSHIETPHGVRRLGGGGIWQFRPDTQRLEVFVRGFWNPWGHHFDRWGQSFITDGAGFEGITPAVPGASYSATPGATRMLPGLNPGHPKYCGCEIVSGRHLPDSWQGSLITCDFRAHRVCRFTLAPSGSGYTARLEADLVRTTHPAFRPIDVKMGPDGAIYVADWYNPIIQHGEVDFRDPRRDHVHGRIWRITAKGRPLAPRPQLVKAPTDKLLAALEAPEGWTRHHARRVLAERGKEVVPALRAWVAKRPADRPENEPLLLEALWMYQSLDVVEPQLLQTLLNAGDYRVRAAATRVLSAWHERLSHPLELLATRVADEHPQVRLEAVRALEQIPNVRAADLALAALDRPIDKYLDYGLWLTLRELAPYWLTALQQGRLPFSGNARRLAFALQAADSPAVVPALVRLLQDPAGKLSSADEDGVLRLVGSLGGPQDLNRLLDRLCDAKSSSTRRLLLLTALEQAARQRNVRPSADLARLAGLVKDDSEHVRAEVLRLAGLWKLESLRDPMTELARGEKTSELLRQAALEGLISLGGPASKETLSQLAGRGPVSLRRRALLALTALDPQAAAAQVVDVLAALPSSEDAGEIFEAFLRHKNGAALLSEAMHDHTLPADVAKVGIRTVRISGRPTGDLVDELTRAGKLTFGARKLTPKEMREMVADVARHGDPARGEAVFRRKDQLCLRCHAIGGAGGQVGPDLASIGASAQVDYLIDSLLEPNKAVKENYHSLLVSTLKGLQYTGIKVRETKTEVVLRTAEDQEVSIPLKDVDEQTPGGSLMPDGLTDTLTRAELLDLVRFLSELGKVGPYAIGKARLARRWQALEPTPQTEQALRRGDLAVVASDDPTLQWLPLYSTVRGELPLADVPTMKHGEGAVAVVRCQLDVSAAGDVQVRLGSTSGLTLWLDGKRITPAEHLPLKKLRAGLHTLTLAVNPRARTEPLRLELEDSEEGTGRARWATGK